MKTSYLALLLILSISSQSLAHPGGLDSSGCHRESATGLRHCHNSIGTSSNSGGTEDSSPLLIFGGLLLGAGAIALFILAESTASKYSSLEPKKTDVTPTFALDNNGFTLGIVGEF